MAVLSTALVGREPEIGAIESAIGNGRGLFFAGPAGVGKTRLLKESKELLEAAGFDVIEIIGAQATADIPLAPLLGLVDLDQQGELARLVLSALTRRARDNKVAMLVDDIQRLDDASASLVLSVAASGIATVFATYRSIDPIPAAAESLWKDQHLDRIAVDALSRADQEELASLMIGQIDEMTEVWLWDIAAGHPLFLRELVTDAQQHNRVKTTSAGSSIERSQGVPVRLFELVGRNVTSLDPDVRRALELVAVGGSAPSAVVGKLAGEQAVQCLIERGLCNDADGTLFLGHPLFGETATATLSTDALGGLQRTLANGLDAADGTEVQSSLLRIAAGDDIEEHRLRTAFETARRSRQPLPTQQIGEALLAQTCDPTVAAHLAFAYAMTRDWDKADVLFDTAVTTAPPDQVEELYLLWLQAAFEYRESPHEALELAEHVVANTSGPANQLARTLQYRVRMFFEPLEPIFFEREHMLDEDLDPRAEAIIRLDQATVAWSMLRIPRALHEPYAHDLPGIDLLNEARSSHTHSVALAWRDGVTRSLDVLEKAHDRFVILGDADAEVAVIISHFWIRMIGLITSGYLDMEQQRESIERRATDRRYRAMFLGMDLVVKSRLRTFSIDEATVVEMIDGLDPTTYALSGANLYLVASRAERRDGRDPEPLRQKSLEVARWRNDRTNEVFALRDEYAFGDPATEPTIARLRQLAEMAGPGLADLFLGEGEGHLEHNGSKLLELSHAAEEYGARGLAWDMAAAAQLFLTQDGNGAAALRAERRSHRLAALDPVAKSPLHELMEPVLTDRETEVAELVADAMSNPEVADALYLSPRTVGRHLERIYRKLGITNRCELGELLG